jgi:hypothetical protein
MIHVRVRDEHVRQAQQLSRRERLDIADVEEECALFVAEVHVLAGVPERRID